MRAAVITGKRKLEDREVPLPETAVAGTAVVEVLLCGVCGSDVAAFREGEQYPPFLSGHEWVARVLDVGEDVTNVRIGDRVVAGTPPACGVCGMCLSGHWDRCVEYSALAFGTHPLTPEHGAYAERIMVPAEILVVVPDAVSNEAAAVVEPAAVALHAVRRSGIKPRESVAVIGAGPVGLFAVQLLVAAGAGDVVIVEPRERRRTIAVQTGAARGVAPADARDEVAATTGGLGFDVVFDCVGNEAAFASAVEIARPGGTIMLVGAATSSISVAPLAWLSKELTIKASLAHHYHEFGMTMSLIIDGRLQTAPLIDRIIGLHDLGDALTELADGRDEIKVLVDPRLGNGDVDEEDR